MVEQNDQSGLGNRIFENIDQSYQNGIGELVPEFYYMPEMFINMNRHSQKDNGDIELPEYSGNDAY